MFIRMWILYNKVLKKIKKNSNLQVVDKDKNMFESLEKYEKHGD